MESAFFLDMAERMFRAYSEQAGGKTHDGKPIPPFSEVGDKVRANWVAAARAAATMIGGHVDVHGAIQAPAGHVDVAISPELAGALGIIP